MRLPRGRAELLVRDPLQPREKIDLGRIGFREGGHVGAVRIAKRRRPPAPRPVLDVPREMVCVKGLEYAVALQRLSPPGPECGEGARPADARIGKGWVSTVRARG